MTRDLSDLRERYERQGLRRSHLIEDPIPQFEQWWDEWAATDPYDAAACVLATADASGRPAARFVLCRYVDAAGFVIYTNQTSHKARDLAVNPYASLVFGWLDLARQVRVEGPVSIVDEATADHYWSRRPRISQLGAWASDQSEVVADRDELHRHLRDVEERFGGPDDRDAPAIPRPEEWGGYRIGVDRIEFWQGQPGRLHDRFEYRRRPEADGSGWVIDRLAP